MTRPTQPTTDTRNLRRHGKVIDQRQQQIDPAGKHREDPNERSDANTKQPGRADPDGSPAP